MSVSRELVLEAVADKLDIQVTDEEIREELRSAGETEEDIEELVKRTEEINGVRAVENLLHLPGTPAPTHH